jgi:outer membrane protein assembly factor BamE (lipoprotein component of BamABCDE complex)
MRALFMVPLMLALALPMGCYQEAPSQRSSVTPGMAKKHIYPGKTSQTEVLEIFGPPNIITRRSGRENWTYDKMNHQVKSSGGFLTILLGGYSSNTRRRSSRTMMLIIYFDDQDIVREYDLRSTHY